MKQGSFFPANKKWGCAASSFFVLLFYFPACYFTLKFTFFVFPALSVSTNL